jgi:hypothetical protein
MMAEQGQILPLPQAAAEMLQPEPVTVGQVGALR